MKIGTMGEPYFFYTAAKHVSFDAEETLLDFDVVNWNPNTLIEDYFGSTKPGPRRKNNLIILNEEQLETIVSDIRRRDEELLHLLKLGRVLCINLPTPQLCYLEGGNLINILDYFTFVKMQKKTREEQAVKISLFQKQAGAIGKDVVMNNKRIPIEINGMKLLALVTYKDLERLERLEQMETQDMYKFEKVRNEMGKAFKDVPEEEILKNLDRIRKEQRKNN